MGRLAQTLRPNATITQIRYFTALVNGDQDPASPQRQRIYLRALRTIPGLTVHYGQFLSSVIWRPLAFPMAAVPKGIPTDAIRVKTDGTQLAQVTKMEEKGSDVNIASYMLLDCFRSNFDEAVIISNDSDLVTPIRIVRADFRLRVSVFNPGTYYSSALNREATSYAQIAEGDLQSSMFLPTLTDRHGTMRKPSTW